MRAKPNSIGIIRNKSEIYFVIKQNKRKKLSRFSKQSILGDKQFSYELSTFRKPLVDKSDLSDRNHISDINSLPPVWIDHYQNCQSLIKQIQVLKKQMMTYQCKRFTVVKESQQKQIQIHIYQCAAQATKKIKKCQKLIARIRNQAQNQSSSHHKTCNSIAMKLTNTLRQKTKQIRGQQKSFIQQRKNIQQSTRASFLEMAAQKILQDDDFNDLIQVQNIELDTRNQQILKIVESIHQLNDLYKELNHMVVLQGSLLDRIDFNIQESFQKVTAGQLHIEKAQTYQKKTSKCAFKFMIILLVAIAILSIWLAVKWTK